jgi:alpha-1,2-mannosyltransferase
MYCADCGSGLGVNYNPPHFHLLMLPLAWLPVRAAFVLWTAFGLGLGAATIHLAMREGSIPWPLQDRRVLMAAALTSAGVGATVLLGQVSFVVALVVTLAWRAARHTKWGVAGAWLGLAISLKPFLLLAVPLLVIRTRWKAAAIALLTAMVCAAVGISVFGWAAFEGWLALLRRAAPAAHLQFFLNGSWAGFAARTQLPMPAAVLGSLAIIAVTTGAVRHGSEDRAWLVALSGTLLASPLGWIYYVPLMAGPLVVLAQAGRLPRWTWALWPLFVFPPLARELFLGSRIGAATLGSLYFWLLVGLWASALRAEPEVRSPDRAGGR